MPRVSRRELFRVLGTAGVAVHFDAGCARTDLEAGATPSFLTAEEKETVSVLADAILPPDDRGPGGSGLGVVPFVDRLLTAFDVVPPAIFANGPFSGRQPFPDANGAPSMTLPPNDFASFMELDRVSERAWQLRLFGSEGTPSGAPNEAILGVVKGLRQELRDGLAAVRNKIKKPPAELTAEERKALLDDIDLDFRATVVDLVVEAAFSVPEYGGNPGRLGWTVIRYEGDSAPLGYTLLDPNSGTYGERVDAPLTRTAGPDPEPISAETHALMGQVVRALGGKVFR